MDPYKAKLELNREIYRSMLVQDVNRFFDNPINLLERIVLENVRNTLSYDHSIQEIEDREKAAKEDSQS